MNREEKVKRYMMGKEKKGEEIVGILDKLKMTWYFNTPFSKWVYVISSLSLVFLIIRLIVGRGLW